MEGSIFYNLETYYDTVKEEDGVTHYEKKNRLRKVKDENFFGQPRSIAKRIFTFICCVVVSRRENNKEYIDGTKERSLSVSLADIPIDLIKYNIVKPLLSELWKSEISFNMYDMAIYKVYFNEHLEKIPFEHIEKVLSEIDGMLKKEHIESMGTFHKYILKNFPNREPNLELCEPYNSMDAERLWNDVCLNENTIVINLVIDYDMDDAPLPSNVNIIKYMNLLIYDAMNNSYVPAYGNIIKYIQQARPVRFEDYHYCSDMAFRILKTTINNESLKSLVNDCDDVVLGSAVYDDNNYIMINTSNDNNNAYSKGKSRNTNYFYCKASDIYNYYHFMNQEKILYILMIFLAFVIFYFLALLT